MLDKGGNAVDAVVAAAFAAGVGRPLPQRHRRGRASRWCRCLGRRRWRSDFREVAPAAATRDMYLRDGKLQARALDRRRASRWPSPTRRTATSPSSTRPGTLKRSVVLAPAIRLARNGFRSPPEYQQLASLRGRLSAAPARTRRCIFLRQATTVRPDVPPLGTVIRQPELARTLEQLSAKGGSVLRSGPLARALADGAREAGGILTVDDLQPVSRSHWRTPLAGTYRGYRVVTFPPPSAGGIAVLQVLGVLERLRPDGYQRRAPR